MKPGHCPEKPRSWDYAKFVRRGPGQCDEKVTLGVGDGPSLGTSCEVVREQHRFKFR